MAEAALYKEYLEYCPDSGKMFWKKKTGNGWAGKEAGTVKRGKTGTKDRLVVSLKGKRTGLARVAWLLYHGDWPSGVVDHINGDAFDNRMSNLRDVSVAENNRNTAIGRSNKSGYHGVYWESAREKWVAQVTDKGKTKMLGRFYCVELAGLVACEARELLGYHPNHGRACAI